MSRFSSALVAALALHGLLLLTRSRAPFSPASTPPAGRLEQQFEIEPASEDPAPPLASLTPARADEAAPATAVPRVSGPAHTAPRSGAGDASPAAESGATASGAAEGEPSVASNGGDSLEVGPAAPERKIDLGLDGHFFMRPPSEDLPRVRKPEFQRQLESSLLKADVQRGLARGNVLIGSLNSAARAEGPTRGEALFQVTIGADGGMTGVEVVQGNASDWGAVLRAFRELASRKRVRVPPGARGLRVTFSVRAKVQRPSGKEVQAAPIGVAAPSLAPNGVTMNGDFDVADFGAGGQRLVYARIVSEDLL